MSLRILITGASIAGPALAWWLHRFGIALQHAASRVASAPGVRQLVGKLLEPPADDIDLPNYEQKCK